MKISKPSLAVAPLLFALLAVGCAAQSGEPVDSPSEGESANAPVASTPAPAREEVQASIDAFSRAVAERDVTALSAVLSSEVQARAVERHIELPVFLEKQRAAIARTFSLPEGERAAFEVAEIAAEGDAARVTLRLRGEELKKPFYFVREGGALKLNIQPPGFSKAAPDGALFGKSNYTVHNVNIYGNPSFSLRCYQGKGRADAVVTVPANSTRKVSCEDACGYWSGTIFQDYAGYGPQKKCDWNAWGDDVVINQLAPNGWQCADSC